MGLVWTETGNLCEENCNVQQSTSVGNTPLQALFEARYERLREIAVCKLGRKPSGISVDATDLVHEALVRMAKSSSDLAFADEDHFTCTVARVIGHILIDRARRRVVRDRVLGRRLPACPDAIPERKESTLLVDMAEALEELELADPASAEVFRLRFFLELSFDEIAAELKASRTSVFRRWMLARAKIGAMISDNDPSGNAT